MWCTGGLGLPLATVLRRLMLAALLACLASLTLLAPSALADDLPASDPPAATDPAAAPPPGDPAPEPPAAADPAPVLRPPTRRIRRIRSTRRRWAIPRPSSSPSSTRRAPAPRRFHPEPAGPGRDDRDPVDRRRSGRAGGGRAGRYEADPRLAGRRRLRALQPEPVASEPTPPREAPAAAPEPVAVVIPAPNALAPASWRWPSPATPGSPGAAPAALTGSFLSSAPPVMVVASTLPGDGGATSGHRGGARHAPPAVRTQPAPWSPSAPDSPFSATATPPAGAAGGLGGWALACLLFVLLALAAPRRVLPRPALSPVLTLWPAHAPARAPPAS